MTDCLVQDYEVEDTSLLTLRFRNGALGVVDCHFNIPDQASEYVLEIHGSQGCIKAAFTIGQGAGGDVRCCLIGDAGGYDAAQNRRDAGYQTLRLEERNTYQSIIEDFSQAIGEGRDFGISGEEGLWNLQIMEAAYRSSREGRMLKVSGE
jgi:predicted dehydrogenase